MDERVYCGKLSPHFSHDHGDNRCPGLRVGEYAPVDLPEMPIPPEPPPEDDADSPLPCRCYFINGRRITTDCQHDHRPGEIAAPFSIAEWHDLNTALTHHQPDVTLEHLLTLAVVRLSIIADGECAVPEVLHSQAAQVLRTIRAHYPREVPPE